jgi:hypothetical protein
MIRLLVQTVWFHCFVVEQFLSTLICLHALSFLGCYLLTRHCLLEDGCVGAQLLIVVDI